MDRCSSVRLATGNDAHGVVAKYSFVANGIFAKAAAHNALQVVVGELKPSQNSLARADTYVRP
jgi:hypothetical protein